MTHKNYHNERCALVQVVKNRWGTHDRLAATLDHAACSYGQAVLVERSTWEPVGPGELDHDQIVVEECPDQDELIKGLSAAGYRDVVPRA